MSNEDIRQRIIDRIPEHWGKWTDVPASWLPKLGELDDAIALIDSEYVVNQCKFKYGGLRYYVELTTEDPAARKIIEDLISEAEADSYRWPAS